MLKFGKYTLTNWYDVNHLNELNLPYEDQRLILLGNDLYGRIHVYKNGENEFRIAFGYTNASKKYTLLKEYTIFYNYDGKDGNIFKAKTLQEAKDKVDLFLVKYDKLKAFS